MKLENPKKHWKEGTKENILTTYYRCRAISIKSCEIGHGAFFEQHPTFDIIFFDISNGTKRIKLYKGGTLSPE
jgi:hypothetical protein